MRDVLLIVLLAGSAAGCVFILVAAVIAPRFTSAAPAVAAHAPGVTILKPLCGDEFGLFDSLTTFCRQDYAGPVQLIFGVTDPSDAAIPVVTKLKAAFPEHSVELVVAAAGKATNPKVANLVNMNARTAHDIIVISDSDIRVSPDYLRRIVTALGRQGGGGAVTAPYYGIAAGGLWSRMSRLNIDGHFLPGVMVGATFKLSKPCMGSTIALSRQSLTAIGGFEAVADDLADDHAMGAALAERGEPVTVLPFAVGHICAESTGLELWRHELRWAMTIRTVDPWSYLGWSVAHAFPLAALAFCFGGGWPALALSFTALGCRAVLLRSIERCYGLPRHPYWLIPLRDSWSFVVFLAGFVGRGVTWKDQHYRLMSQGALMSERRSPSP